MALKLIVLGAPGAGKGTQAEQMARSRGIPKISTGDILREAVHAGTDLGLKAKVIMDRGELVGDDVMIGIVTDRLGKPDAQNGFVLDGFPRTVPQAEALDDMIDGRDPLIVVDIVVPEAELMRRMGARLICADCGTTADAFAGAPGLDAHDALKCRRCGGRLIHRSDDATAVVLERLRVYRRQTAPLLEFYGNRLTFRAIDGAQTADRVAAELAAAVEAASAAGVGGARR